MSTQPLKIVVLISGNGSNLQAIIDAISYGSLDASISAVISSQANAYGLQRAQQAGVMTHVLSGDNFNDRAEYDRALMEIIRLYQPELLVLAGFMRILSDDFVRHFRGQIINIHPSLLPKYTGMRTHQRALAAREKQHGCSIHFVTEELDGGPIIAQMSCDILATDTPDSLRLRVHALEHRLYPIVLQWFSKKQLQLTNDTVLFNGKPLPSTGFQVNYHFDA